MPNSLKHKRDAVSKVESSHAFCRGGRLRIRTGCQIRQATTSVVHPLYIRYIRYIGTARQTGTRTTVGGDIKWVRGARVLPLVVHQNSVLRTPYYPPHTALSGSRPRTVFLAVAATAEARRVGDGDAPGPAVRATPEAGRLRLRGARRPRRRGRAAPGEPPGAAARGRAVAARGRGEGGCPAASATAAAGTA